MKNDLMFAWFDYCIWLMLQMKFVAPTSIISHNAEMEKWLSHFSLNGIRRSNLCKPDIT